MDPIAASAIAEIVVPTVALLVFGGFGLLCFPSIRTAFAERLRSRGLRHAEANDVVAQLNALRGEVYALRTELAHVSHAVGAGSPPSQAFPSGRDQSHAGR